MLHRTALVLLLLFSLHDSHSSAAELIALIDGRDPAKWQLPTTNTSGSSHVAFASVPTGRSTHRAPEFEYTFDGGRNWSQGLPLFDNEGLAAIVAKNPHADALYSTFGAGSVLVFSAGRGQGQILAVTDDQVIANVSSLFCAGGEFADGSVCFVVVGADASGQTYYTFLHAAAGRAVEEVANMDGSGVDLGRLYCMQDNMSGTKCTLFETVILEEGEYIRQSWILNLESGTIEVFDSGRPLPAGRVYGTKLIGVERDNSVVGYELFGNALRQAWRTDLGYATIPMACSSDGSLVAVQRAGGPDGNLGDAVVVLASESGMVLDSFDPVPDCERCALMFDQQNRVHVLSSARRTDHVYVLNMPQNGEE